jgi:hypothetical protein
MSTNICSQCGESNNPEAKFCRRCGGGLAPSAPPAWGEQPSGYGDQGGSYGNPGAPSYGSQGAPSYGEQPPSYGDQPPSFGSPQQQQPWGTPPPPQQPWGQPSAPPPQPQSWGAPPPGQAWPAPGYQAGAPGYGASYAPGLDSPAVEDAKKQARNSLIMGIVGLFCFGPVLGTLAIIFGFKSRNALAAAGASSGQGMAIGGIILGVIDLVLWVLIIGLQLALR